MERIQLSARRNEDNAHSTFILTISSQKIGLDIFNRANDEILRWISENDIFGIQLMDQTQVVLRLGTKIMDRF